ncbi:energy transducer TonB [Phenylobacterium sp. LjRoot225]|uniref:energy transducer TonB n=1 Tax=Phenylobacterium sp. LjRoot225 TaxID=3342285 RepID=UPI003ED147FD
MLKSMIGAADAVVSTPLRRQGISMKLRFRRSTLVTVASVLLPALPASAADQLTSRDVVVRERGTLGGRNYPEVAQKAGVEGSAEVICQISAKHTLEACRVISETPLDCRFGDAIVRFASDLELSPRKRSGQTIVGREFRFKMRFQLPGEVPVGEGKTCAEVAAELAAKTQ